MKNLKIKNAVITAVTAIVAATASFGLYTASYYHTDEVAAEMAVSPVVTKIETKTPGDGTIVCGKEDAQTGLIFYPGGKVEYTAYEPLMKACAAKGVFCVLVKMPFNLAVLDVNAADGIQAKYPQIKDWYIGGHSLGGAMAASYIAKHTDQFAGLVLLGAYSTDDISSSRLRVLSVYGSEDKVLNRDKYDKYKSNLPGNCSEYVIDGGCHSYYGVYGEQKGDGTPSITNAEQISQTADIIWQFVNDDGTIGDEDNMYDAGTTDTIGRSPLIDTLNQNFKVQLPVYRDGSTTAVKEVGKGCSIAFDDYSDEYFYYAPADGAIVFYTPVFGAKTANTKYTRSELREISGSSTRDNWGWDGKHTLVTTESVTKIPANGKVMVCQVHAIRTDGGNGPVPVKVIYEGNAERIAISFTISPADRASDRYYFDNVKIGQKFTTAIDITDGRAMVTIESNGEKKSFEHDFKSQYENYAAWSEYLNYFKAGNYIQDDSDSSDGAASEVRMYDIAVSHR